MKINKLVLLGLMYYQNISHFLKAWLQQFLQQSLRQLEIQLKYRLVQFQ